MFETKDMAFAAFLIHKGHRIASVNRGARIISWVFKIKEDDLASLEAEWPTSEEYKFHSAYVALKSQLRGA